MTTIGKIIKKRTYGIEIETGFESFEGYEHCIHTIPWRAVRDGSLTCPNPVEIVSPILQGESGIEQLREVCDIMKINGADPDHPSCSVHVHIGLPEASEKTEIKYMNKEEFDALDKSRIVSANFLPFRVIRLLSRKRGTKDPLGNEDYDRVSNNISYQRPGREGVPTIRTEIGDSLIANVYRDGVWHYFTIKSDEYDQIRRKYTDKDTLSDQDYLDFDAAVASFQTNLPGKYFVKCVNGAALDPVKNAFYFYTLFGDVHRAMVQDSRKIANAYCMPLDESFDLAEIEKLSTLKELQKYWYKCPEFEISSRKSNHYDDSRYHEVNFHSLWNRHGTVEVRTLAGTIDWRKIALWAVLHQTIVDKCVSGDLTIEKMRGAIKIKDLKEKAEYMLKILELEPPVDLFVRRLINYFNKFKKPL